MARYPTTDVHAEYAVGLYRELIDRRHLDLDTAWQAICQLLMTSDVWDAGQWHPFFGELVLMERNNYKRLKDGSPNRALRDAGLVGDYLARALGIQRDELLAHVGLYFREPQIAPFQPNNLRGHAFRSIVAETLARFGDPGIEMSEEENVHDLFPGFDFGNRSENPRVDIIAKRDGRVVAMASTRWTYRHDRVDMIDEARAYLPAARNVNRDAVFFGVTAEFGTARLHKVIAETTPVHQNAAIRRLVHVSPEMAGPVIGNNGPLGYLMSLADFVRESWNWH